jgi:hypothetical protein
VVSDLYMICKLAWIFHWNNLSQQILYYHEILHYATPDGVTRWGAQGKPRSPLTELAINMVDRHPNAYSWMEDDHKRSQREGGQLPHAGLMAASTINCRRVTLGTGGSRAVISSPRIIIHLGHGIHHFASVLCLLALLGNLVLVQSVLSGLIRRFLRPPGSTMPREREENPGEVLPGTVTLQGRDACTIWRGLYP